MEKNQAFNLQILDQGWLGTEPDEYDLCSHGRLLVQIGGQTIIDGRESYGLSETALAFLRTLISDHTPQNHLAEKLVFHGCGYVLMQGCPIGADWTVIHDGGDVLIKDIVRWDTPDEYRPTAFPELTVRVPFADYQKIVVEFAESVLTFFEGQEKQFFSDSERTAYETFWTEFNEIYTRYRVDKSNN